MSAILGTAVPGAGGSAYTIDNSLRTRASASAYLSKTFASNGNTKTFTFSFWAKRGAMGSEMAMLNTGIGSVYDTGIAFLADNTLQIYNYVVSAGGFVYRLVTTQVFRDPSAWYHIVVAYDTTQATAANRIKVYVNGSQVTAFSTASYPSQNSDTYLNTTNPMNLYRNYQGGSYFDGYSAETHFVNAQQLTPSSFGETNASTGVWQPKAYTGSYGTNGFYLKFSDIATTSGSNAGLGKDFSGNGNYWNTNNISVTSGVTYDAMTDSPTPKSSTVGNFCTLNPILENGWWAAPSRGSISYANLRLSQNNGTAFSTFDVNTSGKWYCELTITSYGQGAASSEIIVSAKSRNTFEVAYYKNGNKSVNNSVSAYGATWTTGDVIGIAIDKTNNQVTFYKNNVSQGAITNTFPSETVLVGYYAEATGTDTVDFNFGQRPFVYTPPTGYVRLQTYNLPTPTIGASSTTLANKYFDATTYTGTGSTQSITNAGSFQPDFVWIKNRSRGSDHLQVDAVRGVASGLKSNGTIAQRTDTFFSSFNSNGFSLPANTLSDYWYTNINGDSEVAWQWRASNTTAVTNTSGSITSSVSANTTAGFSIVTYTGTGSAATVGHGLGVAPKMIIVKCRSQVSDWPVYHVIPGATQYCNLNSTSAFSSNSAPWNNTAPTSTVFTVGTSYGTNWPSNNLVAYCFAEVAGFSKFNKYTGNGSTDGPFVYTGFRPRYVMIKRTDVSNNWIIYDTARSPYNQVQLLLQADVSDAEQSASNYIDILSNGFKMRRSDAGTNASGGTYIFMAFAESPFNYSLAR